MDVARFHQPDYPTIQISPKLKNLETLESSAAAFFLALASQQPLLPHVALAHRTRCPALQHVLPAADNKPRPRTIVEKYNENVKREDSF